jgi:hypothetical protein
MTDLEIARRRDAALLKALSTPHKKQADMKMGRPKPKTNDGTSVKKRGRPLKNPTRDDGPVKLKR